MKADQKQEKKGRKEGRKRKEGGKQTRNSHAMYEEG